MNSNTHGAIIDLGDGCKAFVDGIPDECEHVWNGSAYYVSKSGKFITWKTYRQFASFTDSFRQLKIHQLHDDLEDPIVQSGSTCSKCGKPFQPDLFMF